MFLKYLRSRFGELLLWFLNGTLDYIELAIIIVTLPVWLSYMMIKEDYERWKKERA